MATLISADDAATSAEEIYGSLQHIVKPIEKISLSTPTGTASLQPAYFSLVPTSLKKWYRRWLLLTSERAIRVGSAIPAAFELWIPVCGVPISSSKPVSVSV